ncbi:hypothetical protein LSAT2_013037 [Lamellibrachia satsuma]|nr:hypothetical protein LSAT2_013037 [Lamellibrachia satsuma]
MRFPHGPEIAVLRYSYVSDLTNQLHPRFLVGGNLDPFLEGMRTDEWWNKKMQDGRYTSLSKTAMAVCCILSGPKMKRNDAGPKRQQVNMTSAIRRLDPMMSEDGVLRVDRRVRSNEAKLPIILPKNTLPFKPS